MREYKYMPENFSGKNGLDEELKEFYRLLENYQTDKSGINKALLENQYEDVFFSLKHRVLEGLVSEGLWNEINEYLGGLFND